MRPRRDDGRAWPSPPATPPSSRPGSPPATSSWSSWPPARRSSRSPRRRRSWPTASACAAARSTSARPAPGFSYGLVVAAGLVAAGTDAPILLIGAETLTRVVDPRERGTAILFGDGAGAAVLAPSTAGSTARAAGLGHGLRRLRRPPARDHRRRSRQPTTAETVAAGDHWMRMEGPRSSGGRCGSWSSRRTPPWPGPGSPPTTSTGSSPTRPTPASSTAAASRLKIPRRTVHRQHRPLRQHLGRLDPHRAGRGGRRRPAADGDLVLLTAGSAPA